MDRYDALVVGGGPAGYTAAMYLARAGRSALVLEKQSAGGQMALTQQVENYPGFDEGIEGFALGERMRRGAEKFGARSETGEVTGVSLEGAIKRAQTAAATYTGRALIVATGATHRPLGAPGEAALRGRGVSYCAACDGMFFRGKAVAVVGGGNSAATDALLLSRICQKVYMVHRRDRLRADTVYADALTRAANVEFVWDSTAEAIIGTDRVEGVTVQNMKTGARRDLAVSGVFISVGRAPETGLFGQSLTLDASGYILADETTRTNLPGVFAAGDVRAKAVRQIATAVADGAAAAHFAQMYLTANPA